MRRVKTSFHPEALESLKRYKGDLKAGHLDAAEYWRGQAGAYFTMNPKPAYSKAELRSIMKMAGELRKIGHSPGAAMREAWQYHRKYGNPGAAWHKSKRDQYGKAADRSPEGSPARAYNQTMSIAHQISEEESCIGDSQPSPSKPNPKEQHTPDTWSGWIWVGGIVEQKQITSL